jgi:hypothetical protein
VGELWQGQTKYFDVKPGSHTVQVKSAFLGSNQVVVAPQIRETVVLACRGRRLIFPLFTMIFRRNSYLDLHPVTQEEAELMVQIAARLITPTPRNLNPGQSTKSAG